MPIPYLELAPSGLFATFARNTRGRDFGVGDVHGHADALHRLLDKAGFDTRVDRLFGVGDLTDRGPKSIDVLGLLREPWFHSCRGNHDQWCIEAADGNIPVQHEEHGGAWFYVLPSSERALIGNLLRRLPIAFEIEGPEGDKVGIVHAECPVPDWNAFRELISPAFTRPKSFSRPAALQLQQRLEAISNAMWLGDRIETGDRTHVTGIQRIFVGHSYVPKILPLGNTVYIDTGLVDELSLVDLHSLTTWSTPLYA